MYWIMVDAEGGGGDLTRDWVNPNVHDVEFRSLL